MPLKALFLVVFIVVSLGLLSMQFRVRPWSYICCDYAVYLPLLAEFYCENVPSI